MPASVYIPNKLQGFTLIELMVTVAILAVIASIAIPAYNGYIQTGYRTECQNEVAAMTLAQEEFFLQNNAYFGAASPGTTGIANIETASSGLYVSGYDVKGNATATAANIAAANCTYTVVTTASGGYTITATGANKLSGQSTIASASK